MERRLFFARNGGPVTEIKSGELSNLKPQVVLDTDLLLKERIKRVCSLDYEDRVYEFVTTAYRAWGKYGPEGDLVAMRVITHVNTVFLEIEFIGRLQRVKPSLAADIIPVIIDSNGNSFFVLIHRKYDPGKGKIALIGGNQEVIGYYFQSPTATLQMEAVEEVNLVIRPEVGSEFPFFHKPFIPRTPVEVCLRQPEISSVHSEMILLGTYETSKEEERPHLNAKRINWTTAYLLPIEINFPVDKEMVKRWFTAGDDAEKMAFVNLATDPYPDFGIGHHATIFSDAVETSINYSTERLTLHFWKR